MCLLSTLRLHVIELVEAGVKIYCEFRELESSHCLTKHTKMWHTLTLVNVLSYLCLQTILSVLVVFKS